MWRDSWELKEGALKARAVVSMEQLGEHSRNLGRLGVGTRVFIQNQFSRNKSKWELSGTVMEDSGHQQYQVKVDNT